MHALCILKKPWLQAKFDCKKRKSTQMYYGEIKRDNIMTRYGSMLSAPLHHTVKARKREEITINCIKCMKNIACAPRAYARACKQNISLFCQVYSVLLFLS